MFVVCVCLCVAIVRLLFAYGVKVCLLCCVLAFICCGFLVVRVCLCVVFAHIMFVPFV